MNKLKIKLISPNDPLDQGFLKNLAASEPDEEIGQDFGAQIWEIDKTKEKDKKGWYLRPGCRGPSRT